MNDVARFTAIALFPNFASAVVTSVAGVKGSACPRTVITPPGWVFAVVWPILYLLLGVVMARMDVQKRNGVFVKLFALFLGLNLWWIVFAPKCMPLAALAGILIVLAGTIWLTVDVFRVDSRSGKMMLPLCFWLAFASVVSAKVYHDLRQAP